MRARRVAAKTLARNKTVGQGADTSVARPLNIDDTNEVVRLIQLLLGPRDGLSKVPLFQTQRTLKDAYFINRNAVLYGRDIIICRLRKGAFVQPYARESVSLDYTNQGVKSRLFQTGSNE